MRTEAEGAERFEVLAAALRRSHGIEYALVDGQGRLLDLNPAFAEALGPGVRAGAVLSDLGHPLARKLAEEVARVVLQDLRLVLNWDQGGRKEYEIVPLDKRAALVIGRTAAPASCLIAGEDREELYSKMFLHSQIPMLLIEPASARIADANHAAASFYGYPRNQLMNMSITDLNVMAPNKVRSNIMAARAGGEQRFFFRHRLASGEVRNVEVHSGPIRIAGTDFLFSIVHDITERKQAELVAQQNEQRYRALSDASSEGVVVHADFIILDTNRALGELIGIPSSQLIGRDLMDFIEPASRELAQRMAQDRRAEPYEITMQMPDGRRVLAEIRGRSITFQDRPARVVTILDITERKRFQIALENERVRLRAILDSLPVGVFIADAQGGLVESNSMATQIWGGSTTADSISDYERFKGFWADTGERLQPEDWGLSRALRRGEVSVGEVVDILRFDGRRATILLSAAPIMDLQGNILGGIEISQDITQQKEMERQAKTDKERAELYLDLLTHDINNLNTVAIGYLQLLQQRDLDEAVAKLVRRPLEALQSSSELITSISAVQRAGEGARQEVALGPLLQAVRSEVPVPAGREVRIMLEGVDDLVIASAGLIREAFFNLVDNTVRHSDGPVNVWIKGRKVDGRAVVAVEDDGPGIPDELKAKLFVRRSRGRSRTSGHGLGLFLVRSLVEGHGGTVRVEDRVPGDHTKGTRFVVELPLVSSGQAGC